MSEWKHNTYNKYKIFFTDGTSAESSGSSESMERNTVDEEFKWTAFHIQKEVLQAGKKPEDIVKVEYTLNFEVK